MKILICEDTASVRSMLADMLKDFAVTSTENIQMARSAYAFSKFDLVISDNDCPSKNAGRDWLKQLQNTGQAVVLISGREVEDLGTIPFLQKPFRKNQLLEMIKELLQQRE